MLEEVKEEAHAHMDVTEELTGKARGNNKAYLTAANGKLGLPARRSGEEILPGMFGSAMRDEGNIFHTKRGGLLLSVVMGG